MTTLRDHIEAIRDRHREFVDDSAWHRTLVWCHACDEVKFPCPDREDAVAALAILDGHDDTCTCKRCYPDWGKAPADPAEAVLKALFPATWPAMRPEWHEVVRRALGQA